MFIDKTTNKCGHYNHNISWLLPDSIPSFSACRLTVHFIIRMLLSLFESKCILILNTQILHIQFYNANNGLKFYLKIHK